MTGNAPRYTRFFGLLCAHQWQVIGSQTSEWTHGRIQRRPLTQCIHCGKLKVMP
jgi:hypothetical protein